MLPSSPVSHKQYLRVRRPRAGAGSGSLAGSGLIRNYHFFVVFISPIGFHVGFNVILRILHCRKSEKQFPVSFRKWFLICRPVSKLCRISEQLLGSNKTCKRSAGELKSRRGVETPSTDSSSRIIVLCLSPSCAPAPEIAFYTFRLPPDAPNR